MKPDLSPRLPYTTIDIDKIDVENLDFDPKLVVGDLPHKPVRAFLGRFAAGAALSITIGAGILFAADKSDNVYVSEYQSDVATAQADLDSAQQSGLEADLNYDRVNDNLGEACSSFLGRYMPDITIEWTDSGAEFLDVVGGPLKDTPEDSIIYDAINTPNQPCGERPSDIREDFRSLVDVTTDKYVEGHRVEMANEDLQLAETKLEEQIIDAENDKQDQRWKNGAEIGLIVGLFVSGLSAVFGFDKAKYNNALTAKFRLVDYLKNRSKNNIKYLSRSSRLIEQDIIERKATRIIKTHYPTEYGVLERKGEAS